MSTSSSSKEKRSTNSGGSGNGNVNGSKSSGGKSDGNKSAPLPITVRPPPQGIRAAIHASMTSMVRQNSIKFRREEPDWYDDSSFSGDSSHSGSEMEVMDLRPSDHHAVRHMETSSLVSLGSKSSSNGSSIESSRSMNKVGGKGAHPLTELKFSKMPSSLFNVASSGNDDGNGNGSDHFASGDGLVAGGVEDMPTHWEEADGNENEEGDVNNLGLDRRKPAQARTRSSLSLRISNNGKFLLGESEQAYRALMSLMSSNENEDDHTAPEGGSVSGSSHSGSSSSHSGRSHGSSVVSGDSHRSGFWSELGDAHMSGSEVSVTSSMSETSPLTRESRRQLARKLYIRRCAKAMVGVVALGVLSMSAIYLISTDREETVDMGFLKNMLLRKQAPDNKEMPGSEAEQEGQERMLKFHKLPGGGSIVEMVEIVKDEKGEEGFRRTLHLDGFHPQEESVGYQDGVFFDYGPMDLLQEYNEPFTEDSLGFDEVYQDNIAPQGWN